MGVKKIERPKITADTSYGEDQNNKNHVKNVQQANAALDGISDDSLRKTILDWLRVKLATKAW